LEVEQVLTEQTRKDLTAVKANLLTYGWHRGDLTTAPLGASAEVADAAPRCVMGAMWHVTGGHVRPMDMSYEEEAIAFERLCPIHDALVRYAGLDTAAVSLWNDAQESTEAIIDAIDRALATGTTGTGSDVPEPSVLLAA
jgi:hypothetical protein